MADQKKPPPHEAADRLVRAMAGYSAARIERDQAIAAALNSGGSVRQVAKVAGMSPTQVQVIGRANGWPDAATLKQRADEEERRRRWDHLFPD